MSIAVHVVVFVVAFVTNAWRLDRLDPGKSSISIAVLPPPPEPSGGPAPGVKPVDPTPIKKVVKDPTQPVAVHEEKPVKVADNDGGGGEGNTKGPGTNIDGEVTDTGSCVGSACGLADEAAGARGQGAEVEKPIEVAHRLRRRSSRAW